MTTLLPYILHHWGCGYFIWSVFGNTVQTYFTYCMHIICMYVYMRIIYVINNLIIRVSLTNEYDRLSRTALLLPTSTKRTKEDNKIHIYVCM